ncbi:MAG: hypothetical protein COW72_02410 [Candidatus Nealsonbacteria bacterium CG18_big_fil_WC_8_21_14_2_50_37_10]|uniref:DUF4145 domain-containing protein n=1 Tax=Candidatus Nealsonbacteria bacterium CG18_big_fil_WC_8_21_14_2_50_37_10 TaxID=1974717 RepID=A0A2H0FHC1_9BACT|nr:hypothetical protein [bacterium]PIQ05969.1 MAG: hypothetical protein COW72_02410 [Candidatus Nealsonbacteria bacterium CG18_big_fil_WC_8_21_14_2_50_37_10]
MIRINDIISFIFNPAFTDWLLFLKILLIILSLILSGFIIFAFIKTSWLKRMLIWDIVEFFSFRPYGIRKVEKDWAKITARLETDLESEWKLATIEADSILNDILMKMGFAGETLGERLDRLTIATLPNLQQIREAHKIRNNIVHDPDYRVSLDEAKMAVGIYEQALRDLQAF